MLTHAVASYHQSCFSIKKKKYILSTISFPCRSVVSFGETSRSIGVEGKTQVIRKSFSFVNYFNVLPVFLCILRIKRTVPMYCTDELIVLLGLMEAKTLYLMFFRWYLTWKILWASSSGLSVGNLAIQLYWKRKNDFLVNWLKDLKIV